MFATAANMICCSRVALEGGGGNCASAGVTRDTCSSTTAPAGPIVRYHFLNTYPLLFLVVAVLIVLKREPTAKGDTAARSVTAVTLPEREWPAARRRNHQTC